LTKPGISARQSSATKRLARAVRSMAEPVRHRGRDAIRAMPAQGEAEHAFLLREVHHRIKNNLQVLSSLLNLEASRASSPEVRRVTRILQDRLRAVALVHDQLHRSPALRKVDLRQYASAVIEGISQAHGLECRGIDVRLRAGRIAVGMNDALRVGLVLNELMSNAVAHGFTGDARGRIVVSLAERSTRHIRLTVSNTGVPLPEDFEPAAERLGLAIVGNIARNSGGRFWWNRRRGTRFHVELKPS
jgi:two-component sensor histidine kinase